jgi:CRP-like cAMP-binding protein
LTKAGDSSESQRVLARALVGRALGFADCPPQVLDALVAIGQLRAVPRGAYAVRRGDQTHHIWLVVDGLLESSTLRADGHRHLTGLMPPGDFFGLMGVVDGRTRSHDMCARADTVLMGFPTQQVRELRDREPSLVRAFERQFVFRFRMLWNRLAADPGVPLAERTAGMLCTLGELYGRKTGHQVTFDFKLSQTDLADWLGLTRQRMSYVLKQFEAEGLINLHYATLTILDLEALRARAGS